MNQPPAQGAFQARGFRAKLRVTMMVVVTAATGVVLYIAERNLVTSVENELQREFQSELETVHHLQALRQAALLERCRTLVRRPRIHAAFEDDALDLLYPSARDELRDVMSPSEPAQASVLRAEFYRFIDRRGAVISTGNTGEAGRLGPDEEPRLGLPALSDSQQIGYLVRRGMDGSEVISEVVAMPIFSQETDAVIAALVLGFRFEAAGAAGRNADLERGIWLEGKLHMSGLTPAARTQLAAHLRGRVAGDVPLREGGALDLDGAPFRVFSQQLNEGSLYPPAHEVCVYPLTPLMLRRQAIRWKVIGAGGLVLLAGLIASHFASGRLSVPVEKLEVDTAEARLQRARAEAALESTSVELQRAARFSADASHQLKTPVAVLRAGLEELRASGRFSPETNEEISRLVHQTYRLSGVIDDLLLLSRLDAGRLKLSVAPIELTRLIDAALDDLGVHPDADTFAVETEIPESLRVGGDEHYLGIILQNLLENARKYNRPGGRIRIQASIEDGGVVVRIGNTGRGIAPASQAHIFERFHRGGVGENVPGYGLGLNLARELARLHQGELRLLSSGDDWTEFEWRLRATPVEASVEGSRA